MIGSMKMSRAAIAVHALLFAYVAAALGALWLAMKPVPSFVLLAPLFLHGVAHAARVERLRAPLAALCFWVALALASTVGMYAAAELAQPSVTDDGHPVMPIGQAFVAIVVGPILGVALGWIVKRKVEAPRGARSVVLDALFAVLFAIATVRGCR